MLILIKLQIKTSCFYEEFLILISSDFYASRSVDRQSEDKGKSKVSSKQARIDENDELKISTSRVLISSEPNTALIPANKQFDGIENNASKIEEETESRPKSSI